jgi:hypothetical protein
MQSSKTLINESLEAVNIKQTHSKLFNDYIICQTDHKNHKTCCLSIVKQLIFPVAWYIVGMKPFASSIDAGWTDGIQSMKKERASRADRRTSWCGLHNPTEQLYIDARYSLARGRGRAEMQRQTMKSSRRPLDPRTRDTKRFSKTRTAF